MEGYYSMRNKRKELEDVNDEFSEFSLSSPATKIRRLDAELPPIVEEEDSDTPMIFSQSEPVVRSENDYVGQGGCVVIEELQSVPLNVNQERAIVLFNPNPKDTELFQSPSPYSFSVNSNFIRDLKNHVLWSRKSNLPNAADLDGEKEDDSNMRLAVVPWEPKHSQPGTTQKLEANSQAEISETMETDEIGVASMDVEENCVVDQTTGSVGMNHGLNAPWPQGFQQHCLIPHPPQNLSTPVTWYR